MLLGAPKIPGRKKLKRERGPVLVIANHVTYLDGAFVLAALPFTSDIGWRWRWKATGCA